MNNDRAQSATSPWLVGTDWLAARLGATDLVVVDGSYYIPTTNSAFIYCHNR